MSERRVKLFALLVMAVGIGIITWWLSTIGQKPQLSAPPPVLPPLQKHEVTLPPAPVPLPESIPEPAPPVATTPPVVETPPLPEKPVEPVKSETEATVDRAEKRLDEAKKLLDQAEQDLDMGE